MHAHKHARMQVRQDLRAAAIGSFVFAGGGRDPAEAPAYLSTYEVYHTDTDMWLTLNGMPTAMRFFGFSAVGSTHMHTHARTYACTCARTHDAHTRARAHAHTHTSTRHTRARARTHTGGQRVVHVRRLAAVAMGWGRDVHGEHDPLADIPCTHAQPHTLSHAFAHARPNDARAHPRAHAQTYAFAHAHPHPSAHHTHTHAAAHRRRRLPSVGLGGVVGLQRDV